MSDVPNIPESFERLTEELMKPGRGWYLGTAEGGWSTPSPEAWGSISLAETGAGEQQHPGEQALPG